MTANACSWAYTSVTFPRTLCDLYVTREMGLLHNTWFGYAFQRRNNDCRHCHRRRVYDVHLWCRSHRRLSPPFRIIHRVLNRDNNIVVYIVSAYYFCRWCFCVNARVKQTEVENLSSRIWRRGEIRWRSVPGASILFTYSSRHFHERTLCVIYIFENSISTIPDRPLGSKT